jgi:hypothetical protein
MTSMEAPLPAMVIVLVAFNAVAYDPAEFEHPLCPELSINAPIDICKLPSTPATNCKHKFVCFSKLKISKCFPSVGHWDLVCITEYGNYCLDCGAGDRDLCCTALSRAVLLMFPYALLCSFVDDASINNALYAIDLLLMLPVPHVNRRVLIFAIF